VEHAKTIKWPRFVDTHQWPAKTASEDIAWANNRRQAARPDPGVKQTKTNFTLSMSLSPNTFFAFQEQALHSYLVFNFTSSKNKDGLDH